MTEDHNTRLTQTVDKLLSESNERLQMHLKERMHSLDEKNSLSQECERLRKQIDELESDKERLCAEIDRLKSDSESIRRDNQSIQTKLKEVANNYTQAIKINTSLNANLSSLRRKVTTLTVPCGSTHTPVSQLNKLATQSQSNLANSGLVDNHLDISNFAISSNHFQPLITDSSQIKKW